RRTAAWRGEAANASRAARRSAPARGAAAEAVPEVGDDREVQDERRDPRQARSSPELVDLEGHERCGRDGGQVFGPALLPPEADPFDRVERGVQEGADPETFETSGALRGQDGEETLDGVAPGARRQ